MAEGLTPGKIAKILNDALERRPYSYTVTLQEHTTDAFTVEVKFTTEEELDDERAFLLAKRVLAKYKWHLCDVSHVRIFTSF